MAGDRLGRGSHLNVIVWTKPTFCSPPLDVCNGPTLGQKKAERGAPRKNRYLGHQPRILGLEKAVGTALFKGILREYGRVNQPKLIRDATTKRRVLQMLESATRGLDRLDAVTKRLDPNTVKGLLDKLQVPPLNEIADIKTLQNVVLGLEEMFDGGHAAR